MSQTSSNESIHDRDSAWEYEQELTQEFKTVIQLTNDLITECSQGKISVNLCKSRLKNQADFYALFAAIAELNREKRLIISPQVCHQLANFLEALNSPDIILPELENYQNAITPSSLVYSTQDKNRTKIDILKSVILGEIKILAVV